MNNSNDRRQTSNGELPTGKQQPRRSPQRVPVMNNPASRTASPQAPARNPQAQQQAMQRPNIAVPKQVQNPQQVQYSRSYQQQVSNRNADPAVQTVADSGDLRHRQTQTQVNAQFQTQTRSEQTLPPQSSSGSKKVKPARVSRSTMWMARVIVFLVFVTILLSIAGACLFVSLHIGERTKAPNYSPERSQLPTSQEPEPPFDQESMALLPKQIWDFEFKSDMTGYEQYICPEDTDGYITLINTYFPLDKAYVPEDLTNIRDTRSGYDKQKIRLYAAKALEAFLNEAKAEGVTNVSVTSGYRSYSLQSYLFNQRLQQFSSLGKEGAYAAAAKIVNPPGSSEHQSGLCVDMHNLTAADVKFAATKEAQWLADNCWKFGFILRYPEDKVEVTGISFEPWHFRYVGFYHAAVMKELGMCLEEYTVHLDEIGYYKYS